MITVSHPYESLQSSLAARWSLVADWKSGEEESEARHSAPVILHQTSLQQLQPLEEKG